MADNLNETALDVMDAAKLINERFPEEEVSEEVETEVTDEVMEESEPEEEETQTEEVEAAPISNLEELAAALGVEVADLTTSIKHKFKANGEEVEATLGELVAGYQKDADYRRKTNELAEARRAIETQVNQERQLYQQNARAQAHYFDSVEEMMTGAINSAQMEQLKATNPGMWAVKRQEFADRIAQVQEFRRTAAEDYRQVEMQASQQQQRSFSELVERERKALTTAIPDWNDEMRVKIAQAAKSYGYTEAEIDQAVDHRQIRMALDAMRYHELKGKADAATAKVREAPKMLKPTKQTVPMNVETKNMLAARKRFQTSGNVDDAAALIQQRLNKRR